MKTTINNILEPTLSLGFKTCIIGVPNFDKKVTELTMVKNIATEKQVNELFGEDSIVAQMYRNFRKVDVNGEVSMNAILVPDENADLSKATKHTITLTAGAATGDYTVKIVIADRIININVDSGTSVNDVATAIAAAITTNGLTGYTASATTNVVTLTAKSNNAFYDNIVPTVTPSIAAFTSVIATVASTATVIDMDGIGSFLDKKNVKHDAFFMESGLSETALIAKIKEYETMDDKDMVGSLFTTKFDTYANLIDASNAYNALYDTFIGFKANSVQDKVTARVLQPYEVNAIFVALIALCMTPNANCSKYLANSPIGSLSNGRLPFAKCAFDFINLVEGTEWENSEFNNLENNGVWTAKNNAAENMSIGEITTTLYLTSEGRPITTFRLGNARLQRNVSLSMHFSVLQDNFQHRELSEKTETDVLSTLATIYKTLSGQVRSSDGSMYYVLDERGYETYMNSLKNSKLVNYSTGTIAFSKARQTLLAQLEAIIMNIVSQQYVDA